MSIIDKSSKYFIRTANNTDLKAIYRFVYAPDVSFFGNIRGTLDDCNSLFHRCQTHCIIAFDKISNIVGYAEFCNYSPISALPDDCWLGWLSHCYCIRLPINLFNTIFMTVCVYKDTNSDVILEILKGLYYREHKVMYILIVKPPQITMAHYFVEHYEVLENLAEVYFPRIYNFFNSNTQKLLVVIREDILPKFTYRKALPEDNDEIIEVHKIERPDLHEERGDYYIAEELLRRDKDADKTFIVVAEILNPSAESIIEGFVWLSTDIDVVSNAQMYDLRKFGNLIKFNENEPKRTLTFFTNLWQANSSNSIFTVEAVIDWRNNSILGGLQNFGSGMSVASISKAIMISKAGVLESNDEQKYYERESTFVQFKCIYQQFYESSQHTNQENVVLEFNFNIFPNCTFQNGIERCSNAFKLKYCAIKPDHPLECLFDFLSVAFSAFPERDYCIVSVPKDENIGRSMKTILKYLMPVQQQGFNEVGAEDFYLIHRSVIYDQLSLHDFEQSDLAIMEELFAFYGTPLVSVDSTMSYHSKVYRERELHCEREFFDEISHDVLTNPQSNFTILTIKCTQANNSFNDGGFIGFVILCPFRNQHLLHHHYILPKHDDHLQHKRAEIVILKLHPLFHIWTDELFRCIALKTNFYDFYFFKDLRGITLSNDVVNNMMPIEPKTRKTVWFFKMDPVTERYEDLQLGKRNYFRDHLCIYRHTLRPSKFFVSKREIILIGFSPVARAFLRQLTFAWNARDNHNAEFHTCLPNLSLTVIAAPGVVQAEYDTKFQCQYCSDMFECYIGYQNYSAYVRDTTARMDLRKYIRFIAEHVSFIDRGKKMIKLSNGCELHYDLLLLMPSFNLCKSSNYTYNSEVLPYNFVQISSRLDKIRLYYNIQILQTELPKYTIMIYGGNLAAYECINFLIAHNVKPQFITLILPYEVTGSGNDPKIKNPTIDINVQVIMADIVTDFGVNLKDNLNFNKFHLYTHKNTISEVEFLKNPLKKIVKLHCDLFINFIADLLNPQDSAVFKKSGIELQRDYILVDENYKTNDPNIYALGRHIKMRTNPNYQYQYSNEREAAYKLMHILKLYNGKEPQYNRHYREPSLFQAQMPLGYYITKITQPIQYQRNYVVVDKQCTLTTYDSGDFFRVKLNRHNVVEEMLCITKRLKRFGFLEHFCGKHEAMLNNLIKRYKKGKIKNFLEYFQQPWTELIMHSEFEELHAGNLRILQPYAVLALENLQRRTLDPLTNTEIVSLNNALLEGRLIDFVRKYRRDFVNEFAIPDDFSHRPSTYRALLDIEKKTTSN